MARGATWDKALEERVGIAIGAEARAKGRNCLLAPCVNVVRHPGWGRAQETYGEAPFHIGVMGVSFINGVQGQDVMADAKHFACNNIEDARFYNDALVDERTLREIYLPQFKMAVQEAEVASVMSAYNQLNGEYCSENDRLLREILKGEWSFEGFVVSDWFLACRSTLGSINAGLDIEMPYAFFYGKPLLIAAYTGLVSENLIDDAVTRILRQKFRFGLFDNPREINEEGIVECKEHTELALDVERKGLVLLKNDGVLPINRESVRSIAVVGPYADVARLGDDNGSSAVTPSYAVTPLQGIQDRAGGKIDVVYHKGFDIDTPFYQGGFEEVKEVASKADVVIVIAALTSKDEGENLIIIGGDRDEIDLPEKQEQLINEVASVNKNCIVVIEAGSAITMEDWIDGASGIIMAWYPGQEGGNAIADVIFGDFNPCGKLPLTFPRSTHQLPPFGNKQLRTEYPYYHGYRYFDKNNLDPLFPFGYGLSYTKYAYSNLQLDQKAITPDGKLKLSVDVGNTGDMAGEEIVQLYIGYKGSEVDRPVKDLKGFGKVSLKPGETKTLSLEIKAEDLAYYNIGEGRWEVETIEYIVYIGASSRDIRLTDTFMVKEKKADAETDPNQIADEGVILVDDGDGGCFIITAKTLAYNR
ncbi:MAG: glycoside hydrolase family 3 C-terminal domain-containing protein [Deltaproteobacteria bacterium]|nr:glycoside hydrolase family 3 C-terminal domain-containing protein [Deltaproteobacteria bacterium]